MCQLAGFVINVLGVQPTSLTELVQKNFVEAFVEWAINERGVKGRTLQPKLGTLASVMKSHPSYTSQDFSWFKSLLDGIPLEDHSEVKRRKAEKAVPYELLESIPAKIHTARETYEKKKKKSAKRVARLAMEQLMIQWLLILPWRQRNLRECRINGAVPNLFKDKIPPFSEIDKPAWVVQEEAANPNAEFWQFRFSSNETKTHIAVNALLPRQLIGPLEQYLTEFRPHLLAGRNAETLLLNQAGKPMRADQVEKVIGHWTLRYAGVRTTPHLFRDAVAFRWLKEHPKDYLTLSKMLWHKSPQMVIQTYGARFNESSGVCAMEAWLDQRPAYQN
ncbi:MAG: tyrosine-type recombinase/integrase [Terriglobia bacterium]|nr:tyrosine-type recombinase/integrase [Terriglobia bacterium]